ncbi:MAG: DNA polymerase I [Candidatus Dojkabacteria bacterium]
MADKDKTLLIIDSHALIYRAYFAFPASLTTSSGEPVNAVYGYTSLVLDVLMKFKPTNVIAVMDSKGATAREADYSFYKANRDSADDMMTSQIPRIEEMLKIFQIPLLKIDGIEADDIISTIDHSYSGKWAKTIVVTGDQDLFQLVDEDTSVYLAGRKFSESRLFEAKDVVEKLGIKPVQVPDYKAIAGDASDNIPGVRGIGPKGAIELITEFGTVDDVYKNIERVKDRYKNKLIENQELAMLSKDLATVKRDIPVVFDLELSKFSGVDIVRVKKMFDDLQFKSLQSKLEKFAKIYEVTDKEIVSDLSPSFFDAAPEVECVNWTGNEIKGEKVFMLGEYENINESPLLWNLANLYFMTDSSELVFKVSPNQLKVFLDKLNGKDILTYDLKKLIHTSKNLGIDWDFSSFKDTGIYAVLLSGGKSSYGLSQVMHYLGGEYMADVLKDVIALKNLSEGISEKLESSQKLLQVIELEHKVLPIVCRMEMNGIKLDSQILGNYMSNFESLKESVKQAIYKDAGHEFNINSPKQVGEILFVEKSLSGGRKTKSGAYSTDERSLNYLAGVDPIIEHILEYRELDKILSTYLKPLPEYIDNKTYRVHGIFDQLGAISGRFSSKNPNLQNIPKGSVRDINIRDAFVAEEGNTFISFDYSQQELRILAAMSGEKVMIESFNSNSDVHKLTASEIFGKDINSITPEERDQGKTINFSIIYGISSFGLSDRMKIPRDMASLFISKYFEKYASVKNFMDTVLNEAKITGFTETALGRRRYSDMIKSNNRNLKAAAERELFNFIIQGTAADIMKISMSRLSDILSEFDAKLLLQIHDEFLFEIKGNSKEDKNIAEFIKKVYDVMCNPFDLGVAYKVEVALGKRWGSLEKITLN